MPSCVWAYCEKSGHIAVHRLFGGKEQVFQDLCLRCEDRAGCLARGRGVVLRGMRASTRAVFAAGTSEIEKKKAGNVLTNITCLCHANTMDQ